MEVMSKESEKLREGWTETTLGEACVLIMGQSPPSTAYNGAGNGLPFFQGKSEFGDLHPVAVKWCTEPNKIAEQGDVLLSVRAPVGPTNLADQQCCIGRGLSAVRPQNGTLSKYVLYYLRSIESSIDALGTGTTFKAVSGKVLRDLPFPLAPLPDQRRIVEAIERQLGRLEAGVARLQAAKARLKRYKQAVLKAAYTGQLFIDDADMSDDAQLPEGWRWGTLGDFVRIRNGFAFKSTDYLEEGVLLIRQSNLGGERVTTEGAKYLPPSYLDYHKDFQVKKGDILIGMSGSIGKLCTYDLDEPALQNQRTGLLQFKDASQKPWVWNYLPMLEHALLKQGKGVAVLNISAKQIEASPMPIAPAEVQSMIIDEVEQRMTTIAETESTLDAQLLQAGRLRQAVLKRAFEGRLV